MRAEMVDDSTSMQVTLMPHRRIRLTDLLPAALDISDGHGDDDATISISNDGQTDNSNDINNNNNINNKKSDQYDIMKDELVTRGIVQNVDVEVHTKNPLIKALSTELLHTIRELIRYNPQIRDMVFQLSMASKSNIMDDPALLADFSASVAQFAGSQELQAVMDSAVVEERLQKSLVLLKKELNNLKLQS